jgi:hypothetical protein
MPFAQVYSLTQKRASEITGLGGEEHFPLVERKDESFWID